MKVQLKADMMLLLVTLFWGVSYYMMSLCLREMEPFTINTYRFLGAFIVAAALSFPRLKTVNKITIRYSIYIAVALYFTYIGATFGVLYTSISNAGFLCALSVVVVPILDFLFKKKIPSRKLGIVVIMCIIGIGLLTLTNEFKLAWGDLLCIMCAVAYAVDMVITESAVKREEVNPFQLGVFQLLFTGLFCLVTMILTETPTIPETDTVWFSIIFLTVFCTGVAYLIQCLAQCYTTAAHVGVIFTLEPVFSGLVAFFFAGEILAPRAYVGAILLVSGLFIMELDVKKNTGNC
jgi:drug/metabolite transporter (DMT)-like permease